MESPVHALSELVRQLGLPDDEAGMEAFISTHRPLARDVALDAAPFWSTTQAAFLREQLADDADWAEIVDMLDARLRD